MASTLAESLTSEEIPEKLQCKLCHRLALDAFRLPCCDESLCSNCHSVLAETCPLCSHSPLPNDSCKPNKNLRQTIKSYLRSEEKKRQKEQIETSSSEQKVSAAQLEDSSGSKAGNEDPNAPPIDNALSLDAAVQFDEGEDSAVKALDAVNTAKSFEEDIEKRTGREDEGGVANEESDDDSDDSSVEIRVSPPPNDPSEGISMNYNHRESFMASGRRFSNQQSGSKDDNENVGMGNGFGAFGNWPMNGSSINMNNMMAASNAPANMFAFNAGMMNPAMMQQMQQMMMQGSNMFFDGGMGMNAMNGMNMAAAGFNGGFGWMPTGMNNMNVGGYFGGNNGNFQSSRGNRGGFGRGPPANRFKNDYSQRGRFQGHQNSNRGFGRDVGRRFSQGHSGPYAAEQNALGDISRQGNGVTIDAHREGDLQDGRTLWQSAGHEGKAEDASDACSVAQNTKNEVVEGTGPKDVDLPLNTTDTNSNKVHRDDQDFSEPLRGNINSSSERRKSCENQLTQQAEPDNDDLPKSPSANGEDTNTTRLGLGPNVPQGPAAQYAPTEFGNRGRGGFRGRVAMGARGYGSSFGNIPLKSPTEPRGLGVAGAPTGPKALVGGMSSIGVRGRGAPFIAGRGGRGVAVPGRSTTLATTASSSINDYHHKRNRSRTRSRSPNDFQRPKHRQASYDEEDSYDSEHELRHERRRRSSHKHENDRYDNSDKYSTRTVDRSADERRYKSRHDAEYRHSSRHNGYGEDFKKRKQRGEDEYADAYLREKEDSGSNRRHHRQSSRREYQSHDGFPGSSGQADYDEQRPRREHQSSDVVTHQVGSELHAPKREFKIKDRSKLSDFDMQKERVREEKPDIDPYALEREARQRERLLREEQRRGSHNMSSSNDRKRHRNDFGGHEQLRTSEDGDLRSNRKKMKYESGGKRASYKYDDNGDDLVAKMARTEREREAARWN